jgi:hypothetical protein
MCPKVVRIKFQRKGAHGMAQKMTVQLGTIRRYEEMKEVARNQRGKRLFMH